MGQLCKEGWVFEETRVLNHDQTVEMDRVTRIRESLEVQRGQEQLRLWWMRVPKDSANI